MLISISMPNKKRKDALLMLHHPLPTTSILLSQAYVYGNVTGRHWDKELVANMHNMISCCDLVGNKHLKPDDIYSVLVAGHSVEDFKKRLRSVIGNPDYSRMHRRIKDPDKALILQEDLDRAWFLIYEYVNSIVNGTPGKENTWERAKIVLDFMDRLSS